jgi:hypothetical protein
MYHTEVSTAEPHNAEIVVAERAGCYASIANCDSLFVMFRTDIYHIMILSCVDQAIAV